MQEELRLDSRTSYLFNSNDTFSVDVVVHHDEDASAWVRSIMPENVSGHFFFDGEQIYKFTEPGNEEKIKNAVRNILRIEEIGRGKRHLADIAAEYRRELSRNATGNLSELLEKRKNIRGLRDTLSTEIQKASDEIEAAEILKQDIDARLKKIASSRVLAQERNDVEVTLNELCENKEDSEIKIRELVNQSFVPLAKPVIISSLEILEKNEIASGIPKSFLNELLNQTNCLCGRPIQRESPEYQNILNLLDQAVSSESDYIARETESNLKRLLNGQVKDIPIQLKATLGNLQQLESKIKACEARLEKIKKDLGNFKDNEVDQLEAARTQRESDIRNSEGKINLNKGRIEEINKEIGELDKDIGKEKSSNTKVEQLNHYYALANAAASAMEEIYELHASDMREQIQEVSWTYFQRTDGGILLTL